MRTVACLSFAGVFLCVSFAWAAPTKLAQQGRLLDGDGEPLQGSHELEYGLFDSSSAGNELWSEAQDVDFDDGYYAVTLGALDPLDDLLLAGSEVWLELSVDGVLLEPRMQLVSVPYALRATSAEHVDGGVVDAAELSVGGQLVVDANGDWVGPALPVLWTDLSDVPSDLADGDADTLAGLACNNGQVPSYNQGSGLWVCSSPSGQDTLALLTCTDGQLVTWNAFSGQWQCNDDGRLSEAEVEAFISNGSIDLAAGSTLGGLDLATTQDLTSTLPWSAITGVPPELADGDSDTLLGLPCADGFVARYSALLGAWDCSPDLDTQLSEAQVEGFITDAAINLASGSSVDGALISTGVHTINTDTQLSEAQVEGFVTNAAIDLAAGSEVGGVAITTGAHTVDTDTQLSETQVEGFVTNAAIDLAAGSEVGGVAITTGAHTLDTDTQLSEAQVEGFVTNAAINLAPGSEVGGVPITTGAHAINTNLTEAQVEAFISNGPMTLATGSTVAGVPISTGAHTINTDTHLSESQVESYITNAPIGLASGTTVAGNIISTGAHTTQLAWTSITGMPGEISDGDGDTLASLSCSSGEVAKWSGAAAAWECAVDIDTDTDTDTNTQLTESQVENFVANGPIGLAAGTTVGGQPLAGGAHTTSLAWGSISSIPADIADGDSDAIGGLSCLGGEVARFDSSISQWACDADAVLSEAQVESYITNGSISLATGSTIAGEQIMRVSSTGGVGPPGALSFDSSTLYVDAANNRVGVGTSNPSRSLEVNSSSGVRINNSNSGGGGYLEFTNSGDGTDSWTLERDSLGGFKVAHHSGLGRGGGTTSNALFIDPLGEVAVGGALTVEGTFTVVGGANMYDLTATQRGYVGPEAGNLSELTIYAATDNSGVVTFDTQEGGVPYERMRISNDGNVGIGTNNPTETLSVNGTIESTSGGLKFPDGTVQTSAASAGTPSYYTNTGPWGQTSFASCNSGDIMTGGGCESNSNSSAKQNHPSGNGWTCETNSSSTRAHVRCLDL